MDAAGVADFLSRCAVHAPAAASGLALFAATVLCVNTFVRRVKTADDMSAAFAWLAGALIAYPGYGGAHSALVTAAATIVPPSVLVVVFAWTSLLLLTTAL